MKNLFLILFALAIVPVHAQIEWRNDRTGIYHETGLLKSWPENGPEMLWYYDGLGDGHSSVAVSKEKLYVTGMQDGKGYLYVFDLKGKLLHKKEYGTEWNINYHGTRATVIPNNGKLYIVSGTGNILCFDEDTLNPIWQKDFLKEFGSKNIRWGINESPLIVGEKLILTPGGKQHNIVALNKNNGELIWSSPGKGELSAYCSPLYIGDQKVPLIVTKTENHILGLEASTGKLLWSFESKNRHQIHANTPVYANNMVLCSSVDKGSIMLRLSDGGRKAIIVWESPELDNMMGGMMKVGDYIYGSDSGEKYRNWYCVNWETGEILYRDRKLGMGVTIFADGMLYCYTNKGEMVLVKPDTEKFNIVSQFTITKGTAQHWAHPVIYQGTLYVRHGDSLMAYKIK